MIARGIAVVAVLATLTAAPARVDDADRPRPSWYTAQVAPILEAHCTACHGAERGKAGLRLHTPDAILDAIDGGVILAAADGFSELHDRIGLPLDDDAHMPPAGEPQLAAWQIDTLERWVTAGAPLGGDAASDDPGPAMEDAPRATPVPRELPHDAIAALRAAHVHVEVIDPAANLVWIDFTAVPRLPVEALDDVVRWLRPLAPFASDLSLRGVETADAVLVRCAPWENLRRLDLSLAVVDRSGLAAAAKTNRLAELRLVGTRLSTGAAASLPKIRSLRRLHVWGADIPAETLAILRDRDALLLNEGDVEPPAALDVEAAFEFGPPAATAASLAPVNSTCPVAGAPVDPRFSIVHDGQVVGFCCPNCPGRFWAEPARFPVTADRVAD